MFNYMFSLCLRGNISTLGISQIDRINAVDFLYEIVLVWIEKSVHCPINESP